ncbi:hypothetical protein BJF78_25740 [Pseudonocardia sp. CNS-139]|nr:hypothetical protein BJF78_25740 [Pseudonocardia sp. CNS-139]
MTTATVLLLSTADTELLAARSSGAVYRTANPARVEPAGLPALLDGVDVVVLRLLGGRRAWPEGVDALLSAGRPVVLLGGEAAPDAELMAASTVPAGVASEALGYLAAAAATTCASCTGSCPTPCCSRGRGSPRPRPRPTSACTASGRTTRPARPSGSSSTGRTSCRATRRSSTSCATRSRPARPTRCRSSAGRCAVPTRR